ncbi:serine/threonine-protein kinase [Streptomyces sp. NPDC051219]|uniref:serine/threonine-protein kinase n=1 Tax=Streptomyces sp. NPDC051219 TaxID=3155283 RepID=UPI00342C1223
MKPLDSEDPPLLGEFRLLCRIGEGGFGDVFLARETSRRARLAAIKLIKQDVADSERLRPRFRSEIEAVSRAGGQGIPELLGADPAARRPWLATRYIPGPSLQQLVDQAGVLPEASVWALAIGLAGSLADLHKVGLYHRDLKPSNVLVTRVRPWVIDFSLVRLVGDPSLTATTDAMGSFQYAAPEQAAGLGRAQGQADVFALGATLLFAATGHPPYSGRNQLDIRLRALTETPDISGLSRGPLRELISRCLEFEAADRPEVTEVLDRAETVTAGSRPGTLPLPDTALRALDHHRSALRSLADVHDDFTEYDELPAPRRASLPQPSASNQTAPVRTKWVWRCSDWLRSAPSVHGALVLAVTADGTLCALDRSDGTERWRLDLGAGVRGGLVPAGDGVAVGTADGSAHLVRIRPGGPLHSRIRFSAPVHAVAYVAPADAGAPALLAVSSGRDLHLVDAVGRDRRWTARGAGVASGPQAADLVAVYVSTADGTLGAWRLTDGVLLWRVRAGGASQAGPVVSQGGRVFTAAADGSVNAFDARSGERLWDRRLNGTVHLAPLLSGRALIVGTVEGTVTALDARDGRKLWRAGPAALPGLSVLSAPSAYAAGTPEADLVYAAARDGICALSRIDGTELWRWRAESVASLWAGPGELLLGGLNGSLRSVRLKGPAEPALR